MRRQTQKLVCGFCFYLKDTVTEVSSTQFKHKPMKTEGHGCSLNYNSLIPDTGFFFPTYVSSLIFFKATVSPVILFLAL